MHQRVISVNTTIFYANKLFHTSKKKLYIGNVLIYPDVNFSKNSMVNNVFNLEKKKEKK